MRFWEKPEPPLEDPAAERERVRQRDEELAAQRDKMDAAIELVNREAQQRTDWLPTHEYGSSCPKCGVQMLRSTRWCNGLRRSPGMYEPDIFTFGRFVVPTKFQMDCDHGLIGEHLTLECPCGHKRYAKTLDHAERPTVAAGSVLPGEA